MKKRAVLVIAVCVFFIVPLLVFAGEKNSMLNNNETEKEISDIKKEVELTIENGTNSEDDGKVSKEAESAKNKAMDEYAELKDSYEDLLKEKGSEDETPSKVPASSEEGATKVDE